MMSQLLEEILSQDNMILAYKKVKANRGTSGIDGIGVDEIDEYLRENWETIRCRFSNNLLRKNSSYML